jgi:hypothetical protein
LSKAQFWEVRVKYALGFLISAIAAIACQQTEQSRAPSSLSSSNAKTSHSFSVSHIGPAFPYVFVSVSTPAIFGQSYFDSFFRVHTGGVWKFNSQIVLGNYGVLFVVEGNPNDTLTAPLDKTAKFYRVGSWTGNFPKDIPFSQSSLTQISLDKGISISFEKSLFAATKVLLNASELVATDAPVELFNPETDSGHSQQNNMK